MLPLSADVRYPASEFMSVLLPAPEGPMMAVSSPDQKAPLTVFSSVL